MASLTLHAQLDIMFMLVESDLRKGYYMKILCSVCKTRC